MAITQAELDDLVRRVDHERAQWISGEPPEAAGRFRQDDDMTIVGPFGGAGVRGREQFEATQARIVGQFKGGTGQFELIRAFAEGDVAVVIGIERSRVTFADRGDQPRRWELRSTQVFRRDADGSWVRLHRHADPLVDQRSLDETLGLLEQ